jgi:hypothetical protein
MFNDAIIKKQGNQTIVSYGDDSGLFAEFYLGSVIDNAESQLHGRPIYKSVDFLRIIFPGDNTKTYDKPVNMQMVGNRPPDPDRFPRQWAQYQAQQTQVQDGTPIEQWPPISKAQALNLKSLHIHTVEQLAALSDGNLNWMGARQLRENAKAWLDEAESGAETIKLRNQVEALQAQIEAMQNQQAGFSASVKAEAVVQSEQAAPMLEASHIKPMVTKMRGRPKKVDDGADIPSINAASGE